MNIGDGVVGGCVVRIVRIVGSGGCVVRIVGSGGCVVRIVGSGGCVVRIIVVVVTLLVVAVALFVVVVAVAVALFALVVVVAVALVFASSAMSPSKGRPEGATYFWRDCLARFNACQTALL